MAGARLERLDVEGFTSILDASVSLGSLNVLVGGNGAGKSNLIRVLELLGRIVDSDLELFVSVNGGASSLVAVRGRARTIRLTLRGIGLNEARYLAVLPTGPDDGLYFAEEYVYYQDAPAETLVQGSLGRGQRETRLHDTASRGGRAGAAARGVIEQLRGCRVFHFHDTSTTAPVKQPVSTADNLALRPDAANLAAVLRALRDGDDTRSRAAYRRIVGAITQVAPFFRDFVLEPERSDRLRLRWRERGTDAVFSAHQMSDGTLRFVCLATLLLQPSLPGLLALDEPELGLHPFAIVQLAGLLRQASTRSQVVIATQSVTMMNEFALDDLVVVERNGGGTRFVRPDPERLRAWLEDYSLGELWEKNLIGGRPGSVSGLTDG